MKISNVMVRSAVGFTMLLIPFSAATNAAEAANPLTSTYYIWQGVAIVDSATAQCSAGASGRSNVIKGAVLTSLVRPKGLGSNGTDSRVSFTLDSDAEFALDLAGGLTISGPGSYAAYGVSSNGLLKANVGGVYSNFALSPSAPTVTTPSLTLTGTLENFMYQTGCTVTFHAGYTSRVD